MNEEFSIVRLVPLFAYIGLVPLTAVKSQSDTAILVPVSSSIPVE